MNELRNDQELTTADIANPQRGGDLRAAVIDEQPVSSQTYPSVAQNIDERPLLSSIAQNKAEMADGPVFREEELQNFRSRWDQVQGSFIFRSAEAGSRTGGQFSSEHGKAPG